LVNSWGVRVLRVFVFNNLQGGVPKHGIRFSHNPWVGDTPHNPWVVGFAPSSLSGGHRDCKRVLADDVAQTPLLSFLAEEWSNSDARPPSILRALLVAREREVAYRANVLMKPEFIYYTGRWMSNFCVVTFCEQLSAGALLSGRSCCAFIRVSVFQTRFQRTSYYISSKKCKIDRNTFTSN
jgi:hypothetical protein